MLIANEADILNLVRRDAWRMSILHTVRELDLPDWWVAAGFVRSMVWDALFDKPSMTALPDIDVIYRDPGDATEATDKRLEAQLAVLGGDLPWSVKNQARMHIRNGDEPYASCAEAMANWPETATAIAIRLEMDGSLKLSAPLGIADLITGLIRPTPRFGSKLEIFRQRQARKDWLSIWPKLRFTEG